MDEGQNGSQPVKDPRPGDPAREPLSVPREQEIRRDRVEREPTPIPRFLELDAFDFRPARTGPPTMPTVEGPGEATLRFDRRDRAPPPNPNFLQANAFDIRPARTGPPTMPRVEGPGDATVRPDRPQRPTAPATEASSEPVVNASKRHVPASNGPTVDTPREFEVRRDHAVHTEMPPLPSAGSNIEIHQEGARKRVRVMTTGVFDLIHLGHIHILQAARALGDELYVVIARDETVRRMKHEPLNPEEVRRQIVEGLRPVTKAVLGHVGDIYQSVVDIQPDIIALGFDQRFTEEDVRRKSAEHGVDVRVVRLPEFDHDLDATRKIIERITDRAARKELYTKKEA